MICFTKFPVYRSAVSQFNVFQFIWSVISWPLTMRPAEEIKRSLQRKQRFPAEEEFAHFPVADFFLLKT